MNKNDVDKKMRREISEEIRQLKDFFPDKDDRDEIRQSLTNLFMIGFNCGCAYKGKETKQ